MTGVCILGLAVVLSGCASMATSGGPVRLAADGRTDYEIVVADDAAPQVRAAADDLADHLRQVTGAAFPVANASGARGGLQILVGHSDALADLDLQIDWPGLGPEGFVIRTVGRHLVIAGGPRRGTLNGVYTFLEDVVGCRWYTPTFSVIPRRRTLSVGPLDTRFVPTFECRQTWRFMKPLGRTVTDWAARQRLNMLHPPTKWYPLLESRPKMNGSTFYISSFGHTLGHGKLLPYAEFEKHPEYFGLIDGKRSKTAQPCLTHPDVMPLIIRNARRWLEKDARGRILSISQPDGSFEIRGCQCAPCSAEFEKYGKTGTLMRYVNRVAAALEKDHGDVLIDTFAYHWTRRPPEGIAMHRNVVVRYSPGGGICYHHPFDKCNLNTTKDPQARVRGSGEVYEDLVKWTNISPKVWVWYYAHGGDKMHPVPHFGSLSRNFKRMRDAGVGGVFVQTDHGSERIESGGLLDLQQYLLAKLMWDPDCDVQSTIEAFCRACYGAAAPSIVAFVKLVNESDTYVPTPAWMKYHYAGVEMSRFPGFHCPGGATPPINPGKLGQMNSLFEDAQRAVAADHESLERVRRVRLATDYAIMLYADADDPLRAEAIQRFFPLAAKLGISKLRLPVTRREVSVEAFRTGFLGLKGPA